MAKDLLLPKVQAGERWAALRLLELCSEAIGDGVPLEPSIAEWLSGILYRMSQGHSLEESSTIPKRPIGTKKEGEAARATGRRYLIAHQFGVRFLHEGMKELAAQAEVAELFGVKPSTVESAWKDYRDRVKDHIELELKGLGKVLKITSPPELDDR